MPQARRKTGNRSQASGSPFSGLGIRSSIVHSEPNPCLPQDLLIFLQLQEMKKIKLKLTVQRKHNLVHSGFFAQLCRSWASEGCPTSVKDMSKTLLILPIKINHMSLTSVLWLLSEAGCTYISCLRPLHVKNSLNLWMPSQSLTFWATYRCTCTQTFIDRIIKEIHLLKITIN